MENPDNVKFCKQCGNRLPVTAAAAPTYTPAPAAAGQPTGQIEKRYGTLRGIANLCFILAKVFPVLSILGGIGGHFFLAISFPGGLIGALIISLVAATITYIFWRVLGERIMVLLDNEENTRRAAMK